MHSTIALTLEGVRVLGANKLSQKAAAEIRGRFHVKREQRGYLRQLDNVKKWSLVTGRFAVDVLLSPDVSFRQSILAV